MDKPKKTLLHVGILIAGYTTGSFLANYLPRPKADHRSLLQKIKDDQGDSTLVRVLEGDIEQGWSPVDMILYIPPNNKEGKKND